MAYDLNVQLQIQSPTNANVASVVKQVQNQFKGFGVPVDVQVNAKGLQQTTSALNNISKSTKAVTSDIGKFEKGLRLAAQRFGAFAIGTRIFGGIASSLSRLTKDAVEFERQLNKIKQITGQSNKELQALTNTITNLSTRLGASADDLVTVTKTLNQAGFAARDVEKSLRVLAQTTLGSSFDNIRDTTEGAIAILRQFSKQARAVGDDARFLEQSLDAVNAVSKSFAVESSDIIQAVRRVGGVFATAGGEVNELIALFTSIRATTRESAETIAVGLRTIFTRLQRNDTVSQLENLGVALRDAEGQFVGPMKAIEALSVALGQLSTTDFRFSAIVEELGGIRQVGKVIPLIKQFSTAADALAVANNSAGSVARDSALAQETLAVQIQKTREQFAATVREFVDSQSFKDTAKTVLSLANSFLKLVESLKSVLPLLSTLGTVLISGKAIGAGIGLARGLGGIGKSSGGKINKFARGGYVPGTGNGDTVPAMLTPGEFVIRKSSAQKLGADTLHRMNNNRFEDGVQIRDKDRVKPGESFSRTLKRVNTSAVLSSLGDKDPGDKELDIVGAFLRPNDVEPRRQAKLSSTKNVFAEIKKGLGNVTNEQIKEVIGNDLRTLSVVVTSGSLTAEQSELFQSGLRSAIGGFASQYAGNFPGIPFNAGKFDSAYSSANISQVEGNIFEAFISGLSNAPFDNAKINANDNFDFRNGLGNAGSAFGLPGDVPGDAKRSFDKPSLGSLANKGITALIEGYRAALAQSQIASGTGGTDSVKRAREKAASGTARTSLRTKFAKGGSVDNVPALLTPGEFVINKSAAQKIGYSNLHSMNKTGVARFATGGTVGRMRFANGGVPGSFSGDVSAGFGDLPGVFSDATVSVQALGDAAQQAADNLSDNGDQVSDNTKTVKESTKSFGKIQTTAKKLAPELDKASSKINQFSGAVFLSAGVAIQQFGTSLFGISQDTADAATEALAFGAGVAVAGSNLLSMVANIIAGSTAEAADTAATGTHTGAVAADTAATAKSTTQVGKMAQGFSAAVGVTALLAASFKFFEAQARQNAEKQAKAVDDLVAKFRETGEGLESYSAKVRAAADAQGQADASSSAAFAGTVVAAVTGLLLTAGSAIAVAVGVITAPVAVPIVALGTAIAGLLAYFGVLTFEQNANARSLAESSAELNKFSEATKSALQAQLDLTKGLKDIAQEEQDRLPANATDAQKRAAEQRTFERQTETALQASAFDTSITKEAYKNLRGVADTLGIGVGQLTEDAINSSSKLSAGQKAVAKEQLATIREVTKAVADSKAATRDLLNQATDITFSGNDLTFDQAIQQGGSSFAKLFKRQQGILTSEANLDLRRLQEDKKDAESPEEKQQIQEEIDQRRKRYEQERKSLEETYRARVDNIRVIEEARRVEEAYRQAKLVTIQEFEKLDAALITAERGFLRISQAADNFVAAVTTGDINFETKVSEGFGDIFRTGDRGSFDSEIDRVTSQFGATGARLADQIKQGADLVENANLSLRGRDFELNEKINADAILDKIGINEANVGQAIFNQIKQNLNKAAEEGRFIDSEALKEILGPALEDSEKAAELTKRLVEVQNQNLSIYNNYVKEIEAQYAREIAARQRLVDIELQNAEILEKGGVIQGLTRFQKEALRRDRAQTGLEGTGLIAGDIIGAEKLGKQSIQNRLEIQERKRLGKATLDDVRALGQANRKLGQATAELERLADQAGRIADIQEDIEKERAKRGAIEDIAGDFVFGGQSARESINAGLAGVQAAFQTGTVQNQSEQQRQATLQTLNKLSSIPFFKQLKENLIKQDAARLGIDPRIAQALFNPTGEEQRLQQELIAVTQQRTRAAQALAQLEVFKTDQLLNSEQNLINALEANTAALRGEPPPPQQDPNQQVFAATGGIIRGPGSGRSDSIPARLSNGEYVVNAKSTRDNLGLLQDINAGKKIPGFAGGGGFFDTLGYALFGSNFGDTQEAKRGEKLDQELEFARERSSRATFRAQAEKQARERIDNTQLVEPGYASGMREDGEIYGTTTEGQTLADFKERRKRQQQAANEQGKKEQEEREAKIKQQEREIAIDARRRKAEETERQRTLDEGIGVEEADRRVRLAGTTAALGAIVDPNLTSEPTPSVSVQREQARAEKAAQEFGQDRSDETYDPFSYRNYQNVEGITSDDIISGLPNTSNVTPSAPAPTPPPPTPAPTPAPPTPAPTPAPQPIPVDNRPVGSRPTGGRRPTDGIEDVKLPFGGGPAAQQPFQDDFGGYGNAYDQQRAKNQQAYQRQQQQRAAMFGGNSAQARMNRGQLGRMQAQQMQNRYNARAANFNSSIAQSQMAFRMQAARFVGAGALQGAGGRMLTGGSGYMIGGGGGFGGQMGQQQTNNMIAAANGGGGGVQQMNNMTINHNVSVSGMIAVGGLNVPAIASAITQSVGQLVVQEVQRQLKSMNTGFRASP